MQTTCVPRARRTWHQAPVAPLPVFPHGLPTAQQWHLPARRLQRRIAHSAVRIPQRHARRLLLYAHRQRPRAPNRQLPHVQPTPRVRRLLPRVQARLPLSVSPLQRQQDRRTRTQPPLRGYLTMPPPRAHHPQHVPQQCLHVHQAQRQRVRQAHQHVPQAASRAQREPISRLPLARRVVTVAVGRARARPAVTEVAEAVPVLPAVVVLHPDANVVNLLYFKEKTHEK